MTDPPLPTVRESADALGIRLARIGAAAVTLRGISDDLRASSSREALNSMPSVTSPVVKTRMERSSATGLANVLVLTNPYLPSR